jgi:hypothetical protein
MLLMRFLLTIILFLGGYVNSVAQNQKIQVTGVITSQANKLPILGFSVVYVRDPTSGVNADFDGSYSISLKMVMEY